MRYLMMFFLFLSVSACEPGAEDSAVDAGFDGNAEADVLDDGDVEPDAVEDLDADTEEDTAPNCEALDQDSEDVHVLACCLADRGAVLYHTSWCSFCYIQQRMFGEYFELLNHVDCWDEHGEIPECTEMGVEAYPSWTFVVYDEQTGEATDDFFLVSGLLHFSVLADYSGCYWPETEREHNSGKE